jgi:hypothetical protein
MEGRQVEVNGSQAQIISLPFLSRDFPEGQAPSMPANTAAPVPQDRYSLNLMLQFYGTEM